MRALSVIFALLCIGCSSTRTISMRELPVDDSSLTKPTRYIGSDQEFNYFSVNNRFSSWTARVARKGSAVIPQIGPLKETDAEVICKTSSVAILLDPEHPYPDSWHDQIRLQRLPTQTEISAGTPLVVPVELDEQPTREQAFAYLLNCIILSETSVGISGDEPESLTAFGVLYHQPDCRELFIDLALRGASAGKLYGLMGIYRFNPDAAAQLSIMLSESEESVFEQRGCLLMHSTLGELAKSSRILADLSYRYMQLYAEREMSKAPATKP